MSKSREDLGVLISAHGTSPATIQRAAIVTIVSFLFFMGTLLVFYVWQQLAYFVLSTAFLVVYIFTMVGWVMQRRNVVSIYENGISYRKFAATWDEIKSVRSDVKTGITLSKTSGESAAIPNTVADFEQLAVTIRKRLP